MDLFRRLQEVTELPGQSAGGAADALDAEELREKLASACADLAAMTSKYDALRTECGNLQEEYAAYKVKVQTWRDQMKAARAQDRKTIDMLRESAAGVNGLAVPADTHDTSGHLGVTGTPDGRSISRDGAAVASVEVAYVHSLEEQVKCLKESLREYGNQRDQLALELDKLKGVGRRQALMEAAASQQQDPGHTGHDDQDRPEVKRLLILLERTTDDLRKSERQVADLEQQNEQLQQEAQKSNELLLEAMTKRREDARALEAHAGSVAQQTYIRSLEQELDKWRSAATAANDLRHWKSEVAAIGTSPVARNPVTGPSDGGATTRHMEVVAALEEKLRDAMERLAQQNIIIDGLNDQLAVLESSSAVREESVDSMYTENRQLRLQLEALMADADAAERALGDACKAVEEKQAEVRQAQTALLERDQQIASAKAANQQLVKDLQSTRDALRIAKAEAAAAALASAAAPERPVKTDPAPDGPTDSSLKLSHAQISNLQNQMKVAWDAVASRQRAIWSNQKLRLYYVTALLVCLVLLFTFYQTTALADDAVCEESLVQCLQKLKALPS